MSPDSPFSIHVVLELQRGIAHYASLPAGSSRRKGALDSDIGFVQLPDRQCSMKRRVLFCLHLSYPTSWDGHLGPRTPEYQKVLRMISVLKWILIWTSHSGHTVLKGKDKTRMSLLTLILT